MDSTTLKVFAKKMLEGNIHPEHISIETKGARVSAITGDRVEAFSTYLTDRVKAEDFEAALYHCRELVNLFDKEARYGARHD